jgi:pyruvate formate lyase activating enzyme
MKGIIADIQRFSLHDGPGIRTTVFFKGCPLHCTWCHNPECISFEVQELYYPEKCIGCGKCAQGCFSGARVICGREMSVEELLKIILQDKPYYADRGGVTFSGGEAMAQKAFLGELADACRKEGISTALETSMVYYDEALLQKMDLIMADLKIWDSHLHRQHTGVGNEQIKENFKKMDTLGIPVIGRTPVIPGIDQGIPEISAFLRTLKNVVRYELLPYHPLGDVKQAALGLECRAFKIPDEAYMAQLRQYEF